MSKTPSPAVAVVADVGATHARFARVADGVPGPAARFATVDFASADQLLAAGLSALSIDRPDACCIAIAGPVVGGSGRITNGTLMFDTARLTRFAGCPVRLVNDFHALARGLPELRALRALGGRRADSAGVRVVLGPGSGLGMGMLVPHRGDFVVVPSEGGHGDLAPATPLEVAILGQLQREHGHVCWETVLCGPGLVRLYRALAAVLGEAADPDPTPEWITAAGVSASSTLCRQTLEVFCALLGAAAGILAVTACARGGVYLAGGILPRIAEFLPTTSLRQRFEARGDLTEFVCEIPLWLVEDPEPGLIGAAACLADA